MTVPHYPSSRLHQIKIKSLQAQYEFLKILRLRHLQWVNSTDDPEVQAWHREIADLLEHTAVHYRRLLKSLQ